MTNTLTQPPVAATQNIVAPDQILEPVDAVTPLQRQLIAQIVLIAKNASSNIPPRLVRDATREFQH